MGILTESEENAMAEALRDFELMVTLCEQTLTDLEEMGMPDDEDEDGPFIAIYARLSTALDAAETFRNTFSFAGDVFASMFPILGNVSMMAPRMMLKAVKGATAALGAIKWHASYYMQKRNGKGIDPGAIMQAGEFALLGGAGDFMKELH